MSMTKGTPASSQIITLERMVQERDDTIESLRAELAALKAQQGEPVAWKIKAYTDVFTIDAKEVSRNPECWEPLYLAPPNTEALKDALKVAMDALDGCSGSINPERGYADEVELEVAKAIAAIDKVLGEQK